MSTPLSEVLNPKPVEAKPTPAPEPKVEPKVETKVEPAPAPEKEPKGERATPPVAKEAPKPEVVESDEVRGLKRALAETRAKLRDQEKPKATEPKEFFEDPEGYIGQHTQDIHARIGGVRTELSQEFMREIHPDYDDMESEFVKLAADNPVLQAQLAKSSNPAKFAYETAKKAKALAEMGDPEAMKAQMRTEIEKEVRAKLEKELADEAKKRDAIKPSLAALPGAAGATKPAPGSFHTPLTAILKEQR